MTGCPSVPRGWGRSTGMYRHRVLCGMARCGPTAVQPQRCVRSAAALLLESGLAQGGAPRTNKALTAEMQKLHPAHKVHDLSLRGLAFIGACRGMDMGCLT